MNDQNYVAPAPGGGFVVVVGGQVVGHTADQQTAEQLYNTLTGQSNSGTPGPGGTHDTPNGPKTIGDMTDELRRAGYNGPWDDASVIAAYNRTAGGSGGARTPGSAAALADILASSNSADFKERIREWELAFAEQKRQYNYTLYTDLAKSLLDSATKLQGPANYYQFNKYTSGGRDLEAQLFGGTPRPGFSGATGQIAPLTLDQLMADLGLTSPAAQPTTKTVTADQIALFARNMNIPQEIAQAYVTQNGNLPTNLMDFQNWMTTNGYRNPDGSLTGKRATPATGAPAMGTPAAATPTPAPTAAAQVAATPIQRETPPVGMAAVTQSPTAPTPQSTQTATPTKPAGGETTPPSAPTMWEGPAVLANNYGQMYDRLLEEERYEQPVLGRAMNVSDKSAFLQRLGMLKSVADALAAQADQITEDSGQQISRDTFINLAGTLSKDVKDVKGAFDYGQVYDNLLGRGFAFRTENGRWMTPVEQSSYMQQLGVDKGIADRLAIQADQITRDTEKRITREAFAQLGNKLNKDKEMGNFFYEDVAKAAPFKLNPLQWNNLGPVGQSLTMSAVKASGWDPTEWLTQLKASFPIGTAPTQIRTNYGAGATPAGVY